MPDQPKYAKCSCESCGGHLEFPVELGGSTIDCPHCHFPTPLPSQVKANAPKPNAAVLVAIAMLLLVAVIGYGTWHVHMNPPEDTAAIAPSPVTKKTSSPTNLVSAPLPALVIRQWNGIEAGPVELLKETDGSLVYAVGSLTNISDQQKFGVKVMIDVFDHKGAKIGSATDYAQSLDAGKAWRFRAMVVDKGAAKAQVTEVTQD